MFNFAKYLIVIAVLLYNWKIFTPKSWYEPNIGNMDDILMSHGYPLETHRVTTEDGYILSLHRIPHGRSDDPAITKEEKPPVFLMHGLLCSSVDWVIQGPEKAIALVLADAGYDVWMGNNRGNTFSRLHTTLSPDQNKTDFFNYSYHEIGLYDLPAMIDYVLDTTGYKQLTYIGYSEGFTSFMVMGSLRPEYNKKVLLMNAYAPVTNMYNVTSLVFNFLSLSPKILGVAEVIGWYEMFPHSVSAVLRLLCNIQPICRGVFYVLGYSKQQIPNQESLLSVLTNFPAGMSLKQISHYVQGTRTGIFGPYDYGEKKNVELYGSPYPPSYNLSKVTAPIILYYGEEDNLVNNEILLNSVAKELPNVIQTYQVPYRHFNHLDFIWGKDIRLLTEETLRNINGYNKKS